MATPTLAQQTTTAGGYPQAYPDPTMMAKGKSLPRGTDGQLIGVTKLRQAVGREYRVTTFDCNAANAAITLTGDSIIGGVVRVTNAAGGAVVVNMPSAVDLATALSQYFSISPAPAGANPVAAPLPNSNAPGSWKRAIQFQIQNASGQNISVTSSATITADAASAASPATQATATTNTYSILGSVDTPGALAYTWVKST